MDTQNVLNRRGRFALDLMLVRRDPETASRVMGRCVILRCEMMFARNVFEYEAICPEFDEIELGEAMPAYDVIISNGGTSINFNRVRP